MQQYGICTQTLIALRRLPDEASEMVSQILFGEHYAVNDIFNNWLLITNIADNYTGYINRKLHTDIDNRFFDLLNKNNHAVFNHQLGQVTKNGCNSSQPLVAGSILPFLNPDGSFNIGNIGFNLPQPLQASCNVLETAQMFLNAPYLWGGKTILGVDCSGLVQVCFKIAGIQLPRDASQQVQLGTVVNFVHQAQAGDIAFFDNDLGNITHVGILTGNGTIIHASGYVRTDGIDHQGIYNRQTNKYTHKLRIIKRIL